MMVMIIITISISIISIINWVDRFGVFVCSREF